MTILCKQALPLSGQVEKASVILLVISLVATGCDIVPMQHCSYASLSLHGKIESQVVVV